MTYSRVHERGGKGITKNIRITVGEEKNGDNIYNVRGKNKANN